MIRSLEQRFWSKVERSADGCWLWTGANNGEGYGHLYVDGRLRYAHRVSYEMHVGPIPPRLIIDHLCRVPACVNPAHLEVVTYSENNLRGIGGNGNERKTHCPREHPLSGPNLYVDRFGNRSCCECRRDAVRRYRARRRAS